MGRGNFEWGREGATHCEVLEIPFTCGSDVVICQITFIIWRMVEVGTG